MQEKKGYVSFVLHAHLPFIHHPESDDYLEESWLYEAISETYIPLLTNFQKLVDEGVNFRITMSMTPPLLSMLDNKLLQRKYIRYLKDDLLSFWNATCAYIKEIIQMVGKQVLFNPQQSAQTDLIKDTAWSDTYEILRSKLQQTDSPLSFDSGVDFRNYLIQIAHYRLQNLRVKYTPKEESFDFYPDWEQEPEEETEMMDSCSVVDVDIHNAYEVAYAISIILLDPTHSLYKRLTQGIESKVDILIRKAVKGQTYSQIVEEKYNLYPENSCFNKTVVKTRKEYERLRKMLQDRFVELKKEQEKVSHPIYLSDNK